ncbi:MAG TPA: hypothetical protein VFH80_10305 [Solirubrobacteraceae bacterium]|nr:hypothetical protein [Solirubrobacteraceae bacterium]
MTGHALTSHDAFERRYPDEAEMERVYENSRAASHIRIHGDLTGYTPLREFPCPGSLRVVDESDAGIVTFACDACAYSSSVRREHLPRLQSAPF